jgi:magnesium-transporting ATPase (P-type)
MHTSNRQRSRGDEPPSYDNNDDFDDDDDLEADRENNACSLSSCFSVMFFLVSLCFLGFLTYAIFKYNTDAVRDACPNLLIYINMRTVIGLIFFTSLITFLVCTNGPSLINPMYIIGFIVFYFVTFTIAGGLIIPQSMIGNSNCNNILQDSIFKTPLLGILGWVYVTCDALFSIIFIYILISSTTSCCISATPDVNDDEAAHHLKSEMDQMD